MNYNETMLQPKDPKLKVLIRSSGKRPTNEELAKGEHITFGVCATADGSTLSPLVVLPLQTLPDLGQFVLRHYVITGNKSGWISSEIWKQWARAVLLPFVAKKRAVPNNSHERALLIIDGHSSHDDPETLDLLLQNKIGTIVLPAHSSSILQPLDLAPFSHFKSLLGTHFKPREGEPRHQQRDRLLRVAALCLDDSLTVLQITCGFSRAGIWPFSRQAPLESSLVRDPIELIDSGHIPRKRVGEKFSGRIFAQGAPLPALPAAKSADEVSELEWEPTTTSTTQGMEVCEAE